MKTIERIRALASDESVMMVRGEDENTVFFVNREEAGGSNKRKVSLHRAALKRVYDKSSVVDFPKSMLFFELVEDEGCDTWRYDKTPITDPSVIAEVLDTVFDTIDTPKKYDTGAYERNIWLPRIYRLVYGGEYNVIIDSEQNTAYFTKKDSEIANETSSIKTFPSLVRHFEYRISIDRETSEVFIRAEHEAEGGAANIVFKGWKNMGEIDSLLFNDSFIFWVKQFAILFTNIHINIARYRKIIRTLTKQFADNKCPVPDVLKNLGLDRGRLRVGNEEGNGEYLLFSDKMLCLHSGLDNNQNFLALKYFKFVEHQNNEFYNGFIINNQDFENEGQMTLLRAGEYSSQFAWLVVQNAVAKGMDLQSLYDRVMGLPNLLAARMQSLEYFNVIDFKKLMENTAIEVKPLSIEEFWVEYRDHIRAGRNHAVVDGCYNEIALTEDIFEGHNIIKTSKGDILRSFRWQPGVSPLDGCVAMRFKDGTSMYMFAISTKEMTVSFVSPLEYENGESQN